jgi:hypothetical protein
VNVIGLGYEPGVMNLVIILLACCVLVLLLWGVDIAMGFLTTRRERTRN